MYKFFDSQGNAPKSFSEWYLNGSIKLYRGSTREQRPLEKNEYTSFSLSKEMAIRFTQPGWSAPRGAWRDVKAQNGTLVEIEIPVKSVHFFNNEGRELEAAVKGPIEFTRVYTIEKGKLQDVEI